MGANLRYIHRLLTPPKKSFFLLGPRGCGKSTWLKHQYPDATYIDLLLDEEEKKFSVYSEKIRDLSDSLPEGSTLILDEIQRVPRLLPEIHALIEQKRNIQYIMAGSSPRKLRGAAGDLLGGRASLYQMGPFIASELKEKFSLQKALSTGLIPLVWESKDPAGLLRDYLSLSLRQEIQAESLVRQIGDFANILEDLLLAFTIPVFTRRSKRKLISHPKFYFFDTGVYRILRPRGILDSSEEVEGWALEGLVAQHLRSWTLAQNESHSLSFWRTQTQLEVDFVIYGPKGFWAIEVKRSGNLGPSDVRALNAFKEEYPEATCFFLIPGKRQDSYRGFPILPLEDFLVNLSPEKPLF